MFTNQISVCILLPTFDLYIKPILMCFIWPPIQ